MQQALGWLRWTPDTFWNATLSELWAALTGLQEWEHGVEPAEAKALRYDSLLAMAAAEKRAEQEGRS